MPSSAVKNKQELKAATFKFEEDKMNFPFKSSKLLASNFYLTNISQVRGLGRNMGSQRRAFRFHPIKGKHLIDGQPHPTNHHGNFP